LCLAALPASLVATAVIPCALLIYLAVLCAVQILVTASDAKDEREGESEEALFVPDLQSR